MHWPCPDYSKKIWPMYLSLVEFRNNIFNPIYESGDKITPDINPKCGQMHWPCSDNSKNMTLVWKSHGI